MMETKTNSATAIEQSAAYLADGIRMFRKAANAAAEIGLENVVELHTETARVLEELFEQLAGRRP